MSELVNSNVAEISTGVPVKQGDRVLVAIVDGEPTVISVEGAGDELASRADRTDTRIASLSKSVDEAASAVADAKQGADDAAKIANTAKSTADATSSHFWMDEAGQANVSTEDKTVATGHSVTIGANGIIQRLDGKLVQSLTQSALNFYLANTGKMAASYTPDGSVIYSDGKPVSSFTGSGTVFYDGTAEKPSETNITASFGNDGAVIGKLDSAHTTIDKDSIAFDDGSIRMGYISDSRLNINAGDFEKVSVGKYVLRVDSNGTFVLGM